MGTPRAGHPVRRTDPDSRSRSLAFVVEGLGRAPRVVDLPLAELGPGDVRVRMAAAALQRADVQICDGLLGEVATYAFPVTLGRAGAGIVEHVGAEVDGLVVGEKVIVCLPTGGTLHGGTVTEHALSSAAHVVHMPPGMSFIHAAAVAAMGPAARAVVDGIAPRPGETVLVRDSGDGAGGYVTQLVLAAGAKVILACADGATVSMHQTGIALVLRERHDLLDRLRELGFTAIDGIVDLRDLDERQRDTGTKSCASAESSAVDLRTVSELALSVVRRGLRPPEVQVHGIHEADAALMRIARRCATRTPVVTFGLRG